MQILSQHLRARRFLHPSLLVVLVLAVPLPSAAQDGQDEILEIHRAQRGLTSSGASGLLFMPTAQVIGSAHIAFGGTWTDGTGGEEVRGIPFAACFGMARHSEVYGSFRNIRNEAAEVNSEIIEVGWKIRPIQSSLLSAAVDGKYTSVQTVTAGSTDGGGGYGALGLLVTVFPSQRLLLNLSGAYRFGGNPDMEAGHEIPGRIGIGAGAAFAILTNLLVAGESTYNHVPDGTSRLRANAGFRWFPFVHVQLSAGASYSVANRSSAPGVFAGITISSDILRAADEEDESVVPELPSLEQLGHGDGGGD
ncbi:MAG: hypothetical protein JXA28_05330 [Bacteroidetes bacterium]|nr:hypothetical protein [Bacteroidota bacterium]